MRRLRRPPVRGWLTWHRARRDSLAAAGFDRMVATDIATAEVRVRAAMARRLNSKPLSRRIDLEPVQRGDSWEFRPADALESWMRLPLSTVPGLIID